MHVPVTTAADAGLFAVAATAAMYEGFLAIKRPHGSQHLWRGLIALCAACYALLIAIHYAVTSSETAIFLTKLEALTILGAAAASPMLTSTMLARPLPRWLMAPLLTASFGGLALLPTSLLISDQTEARHFLWAENPFIRMLETPLMWVLILLGALLGVGCLVWLAASGLLRRRAGWHAFVGMSLCIGALFLEEGLRLSGGRAYMSLFEYGFVALALAFVTYDVRRHAQLLEDTEKALDEIVGKASDGIVAMDHQGVVEEVNAVFRRWLGLGNELYLEGYPFTEIVAEPDLASYEALFTEGGVATFSIVRPDGDTIVVEATVLRPRWRAILLMMRDVTARERDQARRLEAGRAEALGTLGTAVDLGLNQPLQQLEASLRQLYGHVTSQDDIDPTFLQEGLRFSLIAVDDMDLWLDTLSPMTSGDDLMQALSVFRVTHAAVATAQPTLGDRATIDVLVDAGIWAAGQPRSLARAILDLVQHASFDFERGSGRHVTVEAVADDDLVLIRVRERLDTYPDEDEEVLPTFPADWDAAGVGLSACREAIRRMGGRLTVRPGMGGFEIALPRAPVP